MVGRRQELVQRLLYVLTYFIRCSELLETHMLDSAEDEAIVMPGSLITTSLRKGEVEESDYVLVTVHKPSGDYLSQGATTQEHQIGPEDSSYRSDNSLLSSTYTDTEVEHGTGDAPREDEEDDDEEDSSESQGSRSSLLQTTHSQENSAVIRTAEEGEPGELYRESNSPLSTMARLETVLCVGSASSREKVCVLDTETKVDLLKLTAPSASTTLPTTPTPAAVESCGAEDETETGTGNQFSRALASRTLGISLEKKPPDKGLAAAVPVPVMLGSSTTGPMDLTEEEPATKVTFLIGASMSPESDTESRGRKVEEDFRKHKKQLKDKHLLLHQDRGPDLKTSNNSASEDQSKQTKGAPSLLRVSSKMPAWNPNCVEHFDEYFSAQNPVETRTIDDVVKQPEKDAIDGQKDLHEASGITQRGGLGDHSLQGGDRSQGLGFCLGPDSVDVEARPEDRCRCDSTDHPDSCHCQKCSVEHHGGLLLSLPVPQDGSSKGDQKQKALPINDWEIPRNESSDSALGDSETEETEDWQEEVLVPFPG